MLTRHFAGRGDRPPARQPVRTRGARRTGSSFGPLLASLRLVTASLVVAVTATVTVAVAPATPAHAADNGSWAVFPTPPAGTATPGPDDRPYFYLESAAGRTLSDHVSVANLGTRPESFRLYATDADNTPWDGGFAPGTEGPGATGVGAWVTLGATSLTVPPRTRADIPFTLAIPGTAEPGDHPGAIVAIETDVGTTPQRRGGLAGGIRRTVGTRIYLHVTGRDVPALSVDGVSVERSTPLVPGFGASRSTLHCTLTNHGNLTLHPSVEVTETGWFGSVYHRPPTSTGIELLPGHSVQVAFALPAPQFDHVSVTVEAADRATAAEGRSGYLAIPWLVVVVVALLLAGLGAGRRLRAKGRRAHRAGRRRIRELAGRTHAGRAA